MLSPAKRVLLEYKTLVVKMHLDSLKSKVARDNLESLCDIETVLGLPCVLLMLEAVHGLIKIAQKRDVSISDFVAAVKMCEVELYRLYIIEDHAFLGLAFEFFNDIVIFNNDVFLMVWPTDNPFSEDYLAFRFGGQNYMLHLRSAAEGSLLPVHRADFMRVVASVKKQCSDAASTLILDLQRRFPHHEVMNALGVIYPQFWTSPDCDVIFPLRMNVLKSAFCV